MPDSSDSPTSNPPDNHLPFVSVVLPVRNEAEFIVENLEKLLQQDYPGDRFEIIVADGQSDDGTKELVEQVGKKDSRVRVVDNPKRITPTAMNILITESVGDIIIRLDGHTFVANDFIRQSVDALLNNGDDVWASGGPIDHVAKSTMGKAIAAAMSHPLGVGNAHHRRADFTGFGEGTAFPAMYSWVFDKIGLYDETLVRNQDDELYFRLRQAGGKFFITPKISHVYFVRERLAQVYRQYYQYSFWRIPVMLKHRQPTTIRQIIPSLFYVAMLIAAVVGFLCSSWIVGIGLPIVYLLALFAAGIAKIREVGFGVAIRIPLAILTLHAGYALGMLHGWFCWLLGRDAWIPQNSRVAQLSR